jgi:hypothetical protein
VGCFDHTCPIRYEDYDDDVGGLKIITTYMNISEQYPFEFTAGEHEETEAMLEKEGNPHVEWLHEQFQAENTDLHTYAQYGLDHVTSEPDFNLSNFFFVLSTIEGIPAEARDFFMDAMVYCEDQNIGYASPDELRTVYAQKISPLLDKTGS